MESEPFYVWGACDGGGGHAVVIVPYLKAPPQAWRA